MDDHFYFESGLDSIPHPEWLVDGLIINNSLACIYGESGVGKSFFALDMAMCIQRGVPFHGRKTRKGNVLYICAEGGAGMRARKDAWKRENRMDEINGVAFYTTSVNFSDQNAVDELIEIIKRNMKDVDLIFIDTLDRNSSGDENTPKDMSNFVENMNYLHEQLSATVCVIHHTGRDLSHERGHTSLFGAMDSVIRLKHGNPKGVRIAVIGMKQKYDAPDPPFNLDLTPIDTGDGTISCILRGGAEYEDPIDTKAIQMLEVLSSFEWGATHTQWKLASMAKISPLAESTFNRKVKLLISDEMVTAPSGNPRDSMGHLYELTDLGAEHIG